MKNELIWRTNPQGRLLGADFHDSLVSLFSYERSGCVKIGIAATTSPKRYELVLTGLKELNVLELWNGAIVNDISVWNLRSVPASAWENVDSPWNVLFKNRSRYARAEVLKMTTENPDDCLVFLSCSYGGTMAATCTKVSLFSVDSE